MKAAAASATDDVAQTVVTSTQPSGVSTPQHCRRSTRSGKAGETGFAIDLRSE